MTPSLKKTLVFYLLPAVVLLVSGCHYILEVELYNNTGQDLVVTAVNGAGNSNDHVVRKGQTEPLGAPFRLEVRRTDGGIWTYDLVPATFEYHKAHGLNKHLVREQIEEDGAIFVLSPGTNGPVTNFPAQPPGYPIRPKQPPKPGP